MTAIKLRIVRASMQMPNTPVGCIFVNRPGALSEGDGRFRTPTSRDQRHGPRWAVRGISTVAPRTHGALYCFEVIHKIRAHLRHRNAMHWTAGIRQRLSIFRAGSVF